MNINAGLLHIPFELLAKAMCLPKGVDIHNFYVEHGVNPPTVTFVLKGEGLPTVKENDRIPPVKLMMTDKVVPLRALIDEEGRRLMPAPGEQCAV